jgi:fibronectin type 3 domain-containing protein
VPATPAKADPDGDGIANTWMINGKAAPAPAAPKASSVAGAVKLTLGKPGKKAKKVRVYRATGSGKYKLVKTVSPKAKTFTDKKVKPGKTYRYKSVAVNAKGQQGAASKAATVKVKKAPKGGPKKP